MRVLNCTIVYLVRGEVNDGSERAFIVLIDILHRRLSEDEWWWLGRLWSFSSQGFFVFEQNFPLWSFLIMIISMSPESCEGDLNLIRWNMIIFCLQAVVSPQRHTWVRFTWYARLLLLLFFSSVFSLPSLFSRHCNILKLKGYLSAALMILMLILHLNGQCCGISFKATLQRFRMYHHEFYSYASSFLGIRNC